MTDTKPRSTEADLVDGIVIDDNDIGDNEIVVACMRDAGFSHTPEEWFQIIHDWRREYGRVTGSIGESLSSLTWR